MLACYHTNAARVVELLLAHDASVDSVDEWGCAALHYAAMHCQADVVRLLLAAGADLNATDEAGATALQLVGTEINGRGGSNAACREVASILRIAVESSRGISP